jgi:hypothetical protein
MMVLTMKAVMSMLNGCGKNRENETVKNVGQDQDDELHLEGRVFEKIGAVSGEEGIQDEDDEAVMGKCDRCHQPRCEA